MIFRNIQSFFINIHQIWIIWPFFDKADDDYTYRAHLPKWMFISPEDLARRIWNNVGYKTREINVPGYVAYLGWAYQVIPGLGDWAIKKFFDFQQDKKNL